MDVEDEEYSCQECDEIFRPNQLPDYDFRNKSLKKMDLSHRDRKLLNKLAKTRATYERVRSEVLSSNECDDSCCLDEDLEIVDRKQRGDNNDIKTKHKVRAMVDVIDRGEIPPIGGLRPKSKIPLDECDTCHPYDDENHRHKNAHMRKRPKTTKKADTYSSSRLHPRHKANNRHRKMRNIHFDAKYIHSDPCTCALDVLGIDKHKIMEPTDKHVHSKTPTEIESKALKAKRCVCEYNIRKKSLQIIKDAKQKVRKSITKLENKFRIKKDSISLHRSQLRKREAIKKYECEPGYCIPEECTETIRNEKFKFKLDKNKAPTHVVDKVFADASLNSLKEIKRKWICVCEPEPEPELPVKGYDKISVHSAIRKSLHDFARMAPEASIKLLRVAKVASDTSKKIVAKIKNRRKKKKPKNICLCEPEPEQPLKGYEKIKSAVKKSVHNIAKVASDTSMKILNVGRIASDTIVNVGKMASDTSKKIVGKIKSKRKEKSKSKHICLCEPDPEIEPNILYDKVKPGFASTKNMASGTYKHKPESGLIDFGNCSCCMRNRRKIRQKSQKTGLNFRIEPSLSPKKTVIKSRPVLCECEKMLKKQARSVICKCGKMYKEQKVPEKFRSDLLDLDTSQICGEMKPCPKLCNASVCVPDEADNKRYRRESVHSSDKAVDSTSVKKSKHSQYIYEEPVICECDKMIKKRARSVICKCDKEYNKRRKVSEKNYSKILDVERYPKIRQDMKPCYKVCKASVCAPDDYDHKRSGEENVHSSDKAVDSTSATKSKHSQYIHEEPAVCECDKMIKKQARSVICKCDKEYNKQREATDKKISKTLFDLDRYPQIREDMKPCYKLCKASVCSPDDYDHKRSGEDSVHSSDKAVDRASVKKSKHSQHSYDEPVICKCDKVVQKQARSFICECDKMVKKRARSTICKCDKKYNKQIESKSLLNFEPHPQKREKNIKPCSTLCKESICVPDQYGFKRAKEDSGHTSDKTIDSISIKNAPPSQYTYDEPNTSETPKVVSPSKQAVRIGSNFSFNIEFYKESKNSVESVRKPLRKPEKSKNRNKTIYSVPKKIRSRNVSIQSEKKKVCNSTTSHDLRRCFCTLALKDEPNETTLLTTKDKSSFANIKENLNLCDIKKVQKTQTKKYKDSDRSKSFERDSFFDSENYDACYPKLCKRKNKEITDDSSKESPVPIDKKNKIYQCGDFCSNKRAKSLSSVNDTDESTISPKAESQTENTTSRNVVRIGSSFSFDIQFYKDREQHSSILPTKTKRNLFDNEKGKKIKEKPKKSSRDMVTEFRKSSSIFSRKSRKSSRNISTESKRSSRPISTQSNLNGMDVNCSTSCGHTIPTFTTSKSQTKKHRFTSNIKAMPVRDCDISRTSQTSESIAFVTPPKLQPLIRHSLQSSPNRTRDLCNPLCLLNKKRSSFNHGKDQKNKKISSTFKDNMSVSKSTIKPSSDASSSKRQLLKHRHKTKLGDYNPEYNVQERAEHRQAVRIGSSFSFNVEFYKDRNSHTQSNPSNATSLFKRDKTVSNIIKRNDSKRYIKTVDKPKQHRQKCTQINKISDAPDASGIKPFLEKCLCTLNLFKSRKKTIRISDSPTPEKKACMAYKSKPCQCEIRKSTFHHPKHKTSDTRDLKVLSSGTSKSYMKSKKMQTLEPSLNGSESVKVDKVVYSNESYEDHSKINKQVVRIGSSFSFNVEFYKERGDYKQNAEEERKGDKQTKQVNLKPTRPNIKENDVKGINRTCQNIPNRKCNKKISVQIEKKENATPEPPMSLLKRCFCSLKLTNNRTTSLKPETKNKYTIAKETKKAYNKRIMEISGHEKGIDTSSFKELRNQSYTPMTPDCMKSQICGTGYNKLIKSKTQKIQSNLSKEKDIVEEYKTPSNKTPLKKSVVVRSSYNFDIEFSKKKGKIPIIRERDNNFSRLSETLKPLLKNKLMKDKRNTFVTKKGCNKKHCSFEKDPNKEKAEKRCQKLEKDIQVIVPVINGNKKQRKVKSVLDVQNPRIKTKQVKSNLREAATKINSDQSIKRGIPKQKHRLHNISSKNATRFSSTFNFDIEFFKQFGTLEDDGSINYKKLRNDQRETNVIDSPKEKNTLKKLSEKKALGRFPRHREYQVGYMTNEVKPPFQQQLNVCYVDVPNYQNKYFWKSSAIVNPVTCEGNPCRNIYRKSTLIRKNKITNSRKQRHVSFQMDKNMQTSKKMKNASVDSRNTRVSIVSFKHKKLNNKLLRSQYINKDFDRKSSKTAREFREIGGPKKGGRACYNEACRFKDIQACNCGGHKSGISVKRMAGKDKKNAGCINENQNNEKNKRFSIKTKYKDENMMMDIEFIKPYSRRNFRKSRSKNCLDYQCLIKAHDEQLKQSGFPKLTLKPKKTYYGMLYTNNSIAKKTYYGMLFARKTLAKIRKSFIRSKGCNVCGARAKTNLAMPADPNEVNLSKSFKNTTFHFGKKKATGENTKCVLCKEKTNDEDFKNDEKGKKDKNKKDDPTKNDDIKNNEAKGKKKTEEPNKPCVCGSSICGKKKKMEQDLLASKRRAPPCICGNKICKTKSEAEAKTKYNTCICSRELKEARMEKKRKENKKIEKEEHERNKCCSLIDYRQKKELKRLAKVYQKTPDKVLVAESLVDIVKMAADLVYNMTRGSCKLMVEPKRGWRSFKKTVAKPSQTKKRFMRSNFSFTGKKVQNRCCAMKSVKKVSGVLEQNAVISSMLHAGGIGPRKRRPKKMRKRKERIDFECSPFMASLRRRPHLWFYDRFPKLYPQCLSLLVLMRQFMDVILFVLAVAVWSPCIVALEAFRAFVCCVLCTG